MQDDTLRFFQQLHSTEQESWIADRFHAELPRLLSLVGGPRPAQQCMLADAGDYFVRILQLLSHFASVVVNGDIADHLSSRADALVDEADLATVGYLDDKHAALRNITDHLSSAASTCHAIWQDSPVPPTGPDASSFGQGLDVQQSSVSQTDHSQTSGEVTQILVPAVSATYPTSSTESYQQVSEEASADSGVSTVQSLSEYLRKRGKGIYFCPHGLNCDKGGVVDGQVKEFNRNSDFRSHMQKHQKMFKCDLPNCPNTTGFARIDQLERHKVKVKHLPLVVIPHDPT